MSVDVTPEIPLAAQLDALFAPWNRSDAPGLVVGVVKDGVTLYRRAFGMASLESGVALTPASRMRIASTSKHFTALLALLLAEDGKLDLDAPIRTYLPELAGPGGDPTARQLLQHRGGSRCHLDIGFIGRGMAAPPLGTALAVQARQRGRNFAPGEAMIYNNGGYFLVSLAIERAGGAPFAAQLKRRLFDPLGMADTALIPSDHDITAGMATLHVPGADGGWRRGLFPSEENSGDGAMVTTIDDMLRWTAHLRARDRFGSPATWAALTERPVFPDGDVGNYALGLLLGDYRGARTVYHSGVVIGATCQMLTLPDHGLDVVILANGAPAAKPVTLAEGVTDIVLKGRLGERTPSPKAADHPALHGDWWSSETGMIYSLIDEEGDLKLKMCGYPYGFPLEARAGDRLVSPGASIGEIEIACERAGEGELTIRFGGRSAVYRKLSGEGGDAEAFARAVAGRYRSEDADCVAVISGEGDDLVIAFTEPHGSVEARLVRRGEDVAATAPSSPRVQHWSSIGFTRQNGLVAGFRLSTMRTRNLTFERI